MLSFPRTPYWLCRLAFEQEGLESLLHHLAALIENLQFALHHPALGVRRFALLQHLDPGMNGIARLHRFGELQAVEDEKGNQRVVIEVELEQQARRDAIDQRPMGDTGAELRLLAVLLIDMQRIVVAR